MMAVDTANAHTQSAASAGTPIPLRLFTVSLPLIMLRPLLGRIVRETSRRRPELFQRIGPHKDKAFLIDPVNLPFALLLYPNPERPKLKPVRRQSLPPYDARIAGSFLTLLDMVDGRLDGDALFFSRDLTVEGDTEATVCLRNALDDLEGSIADDIASLFGTPGRASLSLLRRLRGNPDE